MLLELTVKYQHVVTVNKAATLVCYILIFIKGYVISFKFITDAQ